MNYFAHAQLAAAHRNDPWFTLGAMLPDWQGWIGDRIREVHHPDVAAGVRFHHATDAAFHLGPHFTELVREASEQLQRAGVRRGPARGVAHVGVELAIDGALLGAGADEAAYAAAIETGASASRHLAWHRAGSARRFDAVCCHLLRQGPPRHLALAEPMIRATVRTLARRPRLRVASHELPALVAWARGAIPRIANALPAILADTHAAFPKMPSSA